MIFLLGLLIWIIGAFVFDALERSKKPSWAATFALMLSLVGLAMVIYSTLTWILRTFP